MLMILWPGGGTPFIHRASICGQYSIGLQTNKVNPGGKCPFFLLVPFFKRWHIHGIPDHQICGLIEKKQETLFLPDRMHAESARILPGRCPEGRSTKDSGKTMLLSGHQAQRRLKEALRELQLILSGQSGS